MPIGSTRSSRCSRGWPSASASSAGTLSGGEQQMVAIARGLMSDPDILIIDELSLGLAPVVVYQLLATLKQLKEAGPHYSAGRAERASRAGAVRLRLCRRRGPHLHRRPAGGACGQAGDQAGVFGAVKFPSPLAGEAGEGSRTWAASHHPSPGSVSPRSTSPPRNGSGRCAAPVIRTSAATNPARSLSKKPRCKCRRSTAKWRWPAARRASICESRYSLRCVRSFCRESARSHYLHLR